MFIAYTVTIEPKENGFYISWLDEEKNCRESFINSLRLSAEESAVPWEKAPDQIGSALFHFLDGTKRCFSRALDKAFKSGRELRINLRTCKETADWPFEIMTEDDTFLLTDRGRHVHLFRQVSQENKNHRMPPREGPLRLLFMACSPLEKGYTLNYEQEEEALLEITGDFPIMVDVEDSGSLEGLSRRLESCDYDILHLSGHANIEGKTPFFMMEGNAGYGTGINPRELWRSIPAKNPPRLLFLSGCHTARAESTEGQGYILSFARRMAEHYNIPTVLGWGRSVKDIQASYGTTFIYNELSRGLSIPDAVRRARLEMSREFSKTPRQAWPLLRVYTDGSPRTPFVTKEQRRKPSHRQISRIHSADNGIKVLKEGFFGRRRQLQHSLGTLCNYGTSTAGTTSEALPAKCGVLLLGAAGLGKTCLAGKICRRFPQHQLIALKGRLDNDTLRSALEKAFYSNNDTEALAVVKKEQEFTACVKALCTDIFNKKKYILLLDDFQQNLEQNDNGYPGHLSPGPALLLRTLLLHLPRDKKRSHLVITSRFTFFPGEKENDLAAERLEKIWLTSFHESPAFRKLRQLHSTYNLENLPIKHRLIEAGCRNPLLMEQMDTIAAQLPRDEGNIAEKIDRVFEALVEQSGIYTIYRHCKSPLRTLLKRLLSYSHPIIESQVQYEAEKHSVSQWKSLLLEGMGLGLIEHDQARRTYALSLLLKEKLKREAESENQEHHHHTV